MRYDPAVVDRRAASTGCSGCSATTRPASSTSSRTSPALTELVEIAADGVFMLHPGEFVLGSTLERVAVPDDLVARIEGKSARSGAWAC